MGFHTAIICLITTSLAMGCASLAQDALAYLRRLRSSDAPDRRAMHNGVSLRPGT
jgi:hypothetical protein